MTITPNDDREEMTFLEENVYALLVVLSVLILVCIGTVIFMLFRERKKSPKPTKRMSEPTETAVDMTKMKSKSVSAPNADEEREDTEDTEAMYGDVTTPRDDHDHDHDDNDDNDEDDGMYEVDDPTTRAHFDCEGAVPTKPSPPFDHGSTAGDV